MIKKRWLIALPIAVILVGFVLSLIAPDWMARLGGAATVVGIFDRSLDLLIRSANRQIC